MDLPSVVSINESFYPHQGGAEIRAFETLTRLAKKGFSVKVLTNPFPEKVDVPGLDMEYITDLNESQYFKSGSRKYMGVREFSYRIKNRLKHNSQEDMFLFDEFPLLPAIKGADALPYNKTKFFTWHEVLGRYYNQRGLLWRIAAGWENKVAKSFTNNIAVSNSVASMVRNNYNISNVSVVENGINSYDYQKKCGKEWGKLIYIGRLEPHKRVDQLIKKVKNIPEFNLEVIGSGSLEDQVHSLARDANNINFLGNLGREEMIDHLAKSWIFVMPSYREGFSIASLEAMAASVPVTTIGGPYNMAANEIIRDGENGLVASGFDDMLNKIKTLYTDETAWKRLSMNAKEFSRRYDWEVITEKLSKTLLTSW